MSLKFEFGGYKWRLRAGFPPMHSIRADMSFPDQLRARIPALSKCNTHGLGSWIIGRLNYLSFGNLPLEGTGFSHDTDEFGYKLKMSDLGGRTAGHGAIVISRTEISFSYSRDSQPDFQDIVVKLFTSNEIGLESCTITMTINEPFQTFRYGWDGHSLLGDG